MAGSASGPWGQVETTLAAFEQAPVLTAVLEGPEHRVIELNAIARRVIGNRQPDGRRLVELAPEITGQLDIGLYDRVYLTGEPVVRHEFRLVFRGPNGGNREMYLTFAVAPWRGADGEIAGVIAQAYDVTAEVHERLEVAQRAEAAEDLVSAIQDALLPATVPLLPGLDVAARYLLAGDHGGAGGDWFDVVLRPNGHVALVVGDVVGHGVTASAAMGQLRAVLHAQLRGSVSLPQALDVLDDYARSTPAADAATVCVLELDVATGLAEYCTAGHPPPLVVSPDGGQRFLPPTGAGPMATAGEFPTAWAQVHPDELVLLYSDGVVERPGRSVMENVVELGRVAADTATGIVGGARGLRRAVDRVCEVSLEVLTRVSGYTDDITLLAAQRVPRMAPFTAHLPAESGVETRVRHELEQWLNDLDVRMIDAIVVKHAIGELVSNVVDHAYRGREPGAVDVEAHIDPRGVLVATVADTGRWQEPEPDPMDRGNGLALARGLADEVSVAPGPTGTRAVVRHALARPAKMLSDEAPRPDPPAGQGSGFSVGTDDEWLVVRGPLDRDTAEDLRGIVLQAGRGGTIPVCLDLTLVTHLGSAAVQVLHELRRGGTVLSVVAPPGSTAQHVLELVNVPYQTSR